VTSGWAEKALAFRAAMPQATQVLAVPVLRRMRTSTAEVQALRSAGAAIDRVHARIARWLRVDRTERDHCRLPHHPHQCRDLRSRGVHRVGELDSI
jgi:Xaa-Pro aminopeptidase